MVGVDDGPSRAWAIRTFARLGIPTIVAGLWPPTGNFVALSNRPGTACYFCLRPHENPTRASCSLYSDGTGGVNPALQTAAAALMNVALEALVLMWHGDMTYAEKVFRLDLGTGEASLTGFLRDPDCEVGHDRYARVEPIPVSPDDPVDAVFVRARRDGLRAPVLELPSPFYTELPCHHCGAPVSVMRPDWAVATAPSCEGGCKRTARASSPIVSVSSVTPSSPLSRLSCRELGLGPQAFCVVEDDESDLVRTYVLEGGFEDVFHTVTRVELR